MLKRKIEQKLIDWKNTPDNKPLIIRGYRQCGKTYSALDFAAKKMISFNPSGNHVIKDDTQLPFSRRCSFLYFNVSLFLPIGIGVALEHIHTGTLLISSMISIK
ncbi:hypothetical protein [Dielma fastidiosa]|uniref:AAA domain-containing protein n=1 Tax=Dielma fastidiosa TaxID=1034346 RepID=A0A318KSX7_9FIRM|nr:hypothetical protein [Dielma fastidiosa]PXX80974.1 hypothetical protein DES51_10292 [Dielma fastidiosa]